MKEIKTVWIQTAPARLPDHPGAAEQGFYVEVDGLLTMTDESGKPINKPYKLAANDDEHVIAGRLTRERWMKATGTSDFNRRLNYQNSGIA